MIMAGYSSSRPCRGTRFPLQGRAADGPVLVGHVRLPHCAEGRNIFPDKGAAAADILRGRWPSAEGADGVQTGQMALDEECRNLSWSPW